MPGIVFGGEVHRRFIGPCAGLATLNVLYAQLIEVCCRACTNMQGLVKSCLEFAFCRCGATRVTHIVKLHLSRGSEAHLESFLSTCWCVFHRLRVATFKKCWDRRLREQSFWPRAHVPTLDNLKPYLHLIPKTCRILSHVVVKRQQITVSEGPKLQVLKEDSPAKFTCLWWTHCSHGLEGLHGCRDNLPSHWCSSATLGLAHKDCISEEVTASSECTHPDKEV